MPKQYNKQDPLISLEGLGKFAEKINSQKADTTKVNTLEGKVTKMQTDIDDLKQNFAELTGYLVSIATALETIA